MWKSHSTFVRLLQMPLILAAFSAIAMPSASQGFIRGHVLVKVQAGVDIQKLATAYQATVEEHVPNTLLYTLVPPATIDEPTFVKKIVRDSRVVYAETEAAINSVEFGHTGFHFAFDKGPSAGSYINSTAYQQVNYGNTVKIADGKGIIVAVLDTGATFNHPALKGHYLPGYNAINPKLPPTEQSDGAKNYAVGHGTMVAGIIARLAPRAQILPIRVLNGDGDGAMADVIVGVEYAIAKGARVINISFGAIQPSSALNDTLDQAEAAGIVIVVAAGNDNVEQPPYPAVGRGAIAVTSVEASNKKSGYANYGSFVHVDAPGTGIRSTYFDGKYATWSGTSFSAPFVSATAALVLSAHPTFTPEMVRSSLRKTAHSVDSANPTYKGKLGNGIIDIEAAVRYSGH